MQPNKKSSPSITARVCAVLALFAAVIGLLMVVGGSFDSGGEENDGQSASSATPGEIEGCEPDAQEAIDQGYYVIQEGENLATVSEKTCLEEESLRELNPELDPQTIPVQGCVSLVEEGCKAAG